MIKQDKADTPRSAIVEIPLLKAMATHETFKNHIDDIVLDKLLIETKTLLIDYRKYFDIYPDHHKVEWNLFLTQFHINFHSGDMTHEDHEWYTQAIHTVRDDAGIDAESALLGIINKQFVDQINEMGRTSFNSDNIRKLLEQYETKYAGIISDDDKDCFTCDDVDFNTIDRSQGIPWAFPALQDTIGGSVLGSLVLFNAAYGIGKSAFVHTQLVHAIEWLRKNKDTRPILWFNTEGSPSEVYGRFWSNLYKDKVPEGYKAIMRQYNRVNEHYKKKYGKYSFLVFRSNAKGINYIRMKVKKYKPALIILDMAAAIAVGKNNQPDVARLEGFFNDLRDLSSEYCPVYATVQAGDGAKYWCNINKKMMFKEWVDSENIYNSKSAVQGAAETIISIGRNNTSEFERYIQTTKVKSEAENCRFICQLEKKYSNYAFTTNFGGSNGTSLQGTDDNAGV